MSNISVEGKGPKGPQISESLQPAAVSGYTRGLAVAYGADENHATLATVLGQACIGLIEEDAVNTGNPIRVIIHGQTVAQIGAAVNKSDLLATNAAGQLVPATAGDYVIARALEASSSAGDYVAVFVLGGAAQAPGDVVTHIAAAGAIPPVTGTYGIGSGGALAMTLAAPSVAQDGTILFITAETTHAHTITTPAAGINGASHIATFATRGDSVTLEAVGGTWNVRGLAGGTVIS